jgi:hypothetical protein
MKTFGDPIPVTGTISPIIASTPPAPTRPQFNRPVTGINVVYGVKPLKPIFGAPEGRQRLRMRNTSPAKLFVKTATGIRCFILEDCGDRWFCNPRLEQGCNHRF